MIGGVLMNQKKLSEKTYKILETENSHLGASKETRGAIRAMEFKNGTNKLIGPSELIEVETNTRKRQEDFSPIEQLSIELAERIVPIITEYLKDKALSNFECWLQNRRKQNRQEKKVEQGSVFTRKTKVEQILESQKANSDEIATSEKTEPNTPYIEFDSAYEEYRINMTSDEVKKELIDIFVFSVIRAKKIWKVSHSNVLDAPGLNCEYLEGKVLIERLCSPEVLDNINALLESKPALLEEWESMVLSNIVGHSLFMEGQFVPIESDSFKLALTVTS